MQPHLPLATRPGREPDRRRPPRGPNNLTYLSLKGNKIHGPIPEELGNATSLSWLDLSGNTFDGPIPESLSNLTKLAALDVSNNKLTGRRSCREVQFQLVPWQHPALRLQSLATMPIAVTRTVLVGIPSGFSVHGPSPDVPEQYFYNWYQRRPPSTREVILIVCGCVLAVMLLLCCVLLWCLVRNKVLSSRSRAKQRSIAASGDGDTSGNQVTVKRLREKVSKGPREFETEVSVLGGIRHPNLLELRAYYLGPKGEKLLVFDYMHKGSLAAYLHARGPDTTID